MPQRRAAKKDLRKSAKKRQDNLVMRQKIKTALKKFKKTLESNDTTKNQEALKLVYKVLDKAASKNILHKKKAARKKSQLAKLVKLSAGTKA